MAPPDPGGFVVQSSSQKSELAKNLVLVRRVLFPFSVTQDTPHGASLEMSRRGPNKSSMNNA